MTVNPTILGYSKKQKFVKPFVDAIGGRMATDPDEIYANTTLPMVFSGISKVAVFNQAKKHNLDWWYIDTGYMGNGQEKLYFRITKNNYQNIQPLQERPRDRLDLLGLDRTQYARGEKIAIVPPDAKLCSGGYNLPSPDIWIQETIDKIKQYTDREIIIRQRPASREVRGTSNRFIDYIREQRVNAVVIHTSNAGVEAVIHGIPVVCLGPSACTQVAGSIEQIDNLPDLTQDRVDLWLRWLSYNQFTRREMQRGLAWKYLNNL
jgi:hypothetical protein